MLRRICVLTTSRADFGIYRPVVDALNEAPDFDTGFFVTGQHFREDMGHSIDEIERLDYPIWARAEISEMSDAPADAARTMSRCIAAVADFLESPQQVDLVIALGDRYEMLAAVSAVQPFVIPVAHLHGGEVTEGAFDNAMRHAISKLSHLHFVSTELARSRLLSMGENPDRVIVSGAPSLDRVVTGKRIDMKELSARFGLPEDPFVLATFHPETLSGPGSSAAANAAEQLDAFVSALRDFSKPVVFTAANIDPGGIAVNEVLRNLALREPQQFFFVENFGADAYFSVLANALLVAGNSSSGILEAASFSVPVVDIGARQAGRERSSNIINAPIEYHAIAKALEEADSTPFREIAAASVNVYGDGNAAPRIVSGLRDYLDSNEPLHKKFYSV